MDFDLSDDQRLLKESVDRLIQDRYGFEARRGFAREPGGWSRAVWAQFAELGLLGLPFAEEHGGFGGGPVELSIVMEAFGRALVLEPYFATVVLAGSLLRHAADVSILSELVPAITAGEHVLAFAGAERQSRWSLNDVAVRAEDLGGWRVSGEKGLVLHGDSADQFIVSARTEGEHRDRHGIGLFLIDAEAAGVTRRGYPTQDGSRAAEVMFANTPARLMRLDALDAIEAAIDEVNAALCAEAVGAMETMHALTIDYLKTRKQFGRPIGDNQALQHRAVDMYVALEQARSMAMFATVMCTDTDATERARATHAARVQIGRSGRLIGQEAVQLHGGIGVTMEYSVGHYFKRLTMIERQFGDTDTHLSALARLGGLIAA